MLTALLTALVTAAAGIALWALVWAIRRLHGLRPLPQAIFEPNGGSEVDIEVTAIVPARNEAANIERCVRSLLDQTCVGVHLNIVVVDDGSTDDTKAISERIALDHASVSVIVLDGPPEGWMGKPYACCTGFQASRGEWLWFVDADTFPSSTTLSSLLTFAEGEHIDLVSLFPGQELLSFWERLLMPPAGLLVAMAASANAAAVNDDAKPDAIAVGACLLVRRQAYEAAGGHEAVKNEVIEDVALARVMKHAGYRIRLMDGSNFIKVRMYRSLREIWRGVVKTIGPAARSSVHATALGLGASTVPWICSGGFAAGLILTMRGHHTATLDVLMATAGGIGALTGMALYAAVARRSSIREWPATMWLYPFASSAIGGATLFSAWATATGRLQWKGRRVTSAGTVRKETEPSSPRSE